MNCPICNQILSPNIINNDILSNHWRSNQCNFTNFTGDTLDLYQFFLTDSLLLINTILKLPKVKYLYITTPYNKKYQLIKNTSILPKFGLSSSAEILVLKFVNLNSLVQIPYENVQKIEIQTESYQLTLNIQQLDNIKLITSQKYSKLNSFFTPANDDYSITTITANIFSAAKRRNQFLFLAQNLPYLISCLLPQILTLDSLKLPDRKESSSYCIQRYSFPHKNMFPVQKKQVQVNKVSSLLQKIQLMNKQYQNQLIYGNNVNFMLLYKNVISPQSVQFPLKQNNFRFFSEIGKTQKAMLLQQVQTPRIVKLTENDGRQNTGNFSSNAANLKEFGIFTSISASEDQVYIGTENGFVIQINSLLCFAEQEDIKITKFSNQKILYLNILNKDIFFSTENEFFENQKVVKQVDETILKVYQTGPNLLILTQNSIFRNGEKLLLKNATAAISTPKFDIFGFKTGRIQIFVSDSLLHEQAVSEFEIVQILFNCCLNLLIIVDENGNMFSIDIITKQILSILKNQIQFKINQKVLFSKSKVVVCRDKIISVYESDFRLFREIFIENDILEICEIGEGNFVLITVGVDGNEVILVDLMKE